MTGGDSFHLLTFVPTPEYIHNPTEAFSQIAMKGTSRFFHGYQHENPVDEGYILLIPNGETHGNSQKHADLTNKVGKSSGPNFEVQFENAVEAINAFMSPIVEIAFITMKPQHIIEDIAEHLETLVNQDTKTVLGATWGKTNREELAIMVVGWESLEAHEEVVKNPTPEIQALFGTFLPKVELKAIHVKFHEAS